MEVERGFGLFCFPACLRFFGSVLLEEEKLMDYHSIQGEKAKAMMRYRRLRNVAKMWRLLEVVVALLALSWSSTRLPVAVKLAGQCFVQLSDYIFNPHINFVIGNAIIVLLVLLYRRNNDGNNSGPGGGHGDEIVQNAEAQQRICTENPEPAEVHNSSGDVREVVVVSLNAVTETQCDAAGTAIQQAARQIRRFERTQSEKLKRDLRAKPHPALRRSETEIKPRAVTECGHDVRAYSSFDTVDRLSSEEFRRMIEAFIAKHQRLLWAQKMAENNQ